MTLSYSKAKLPEIAEINPRLPAIPSDGELVSFVPMSAVSETGQLETLEERKYEEVSKGYTPFVRGDILVAKITPCFENGKIAHVNEIPHPVGFGSSEFHVIRPRTDYVDARYLFHFLRQDWIRRDGELKMTGSAGQRRVPESFLRQLDVPVPPFSAQRRIAEVLDRAESLWRKRQGALDQLSALSDALFVELFQGALSTGQWPIVRLGDVAEIQGGLQLSGKRHLLPIEVPYLRVANVYRGYVDLAEIKTLRATAEEVSRTRLRANDLLIVEGHGNPTEIGRCALWDGSIDPCVHQNHLIRVRVDHERLHPVFLCHYLNSPQGRQHLLRSARTTSGLNTISTSNVRETPVIVPPMSLQKQFVERVAHVEQLKAIHRASLAQLESLYASLQHRAFRGEL